MSLKGSLHTVALPEVLNFLSDTGKSGEFHMSGSHGEGRLWFEDGRISGFKAARAEKAFEAIFELLRLDDGEFTFDDEAERPSDVKDAGEEDGQVGPALEAAEARMAEWREIVEVVPSLSHRLHLSASEPAEPVNLEPSQWMMVVAIGAGHTVGEVIEERGLQEFDGCRALRALVDASLVEVHQPEVHEEVAESPSGFDSEPGGFAPYTEAAEPDAADYTFEPVAGEAVTEADAEQTPVESEYQADDAQEGDHYAALRAAMVEIGDDLGTEEGAPADEYPAHTYELAIEPGTDSRAALQALLSEVTAEGGAEPVAGYDDQVDGLADRGPWTQHELSAMDTEQDWHEPGDESSNIVPFAPVHAEAEAGEVGADAADVEADEAEEDAPIEAPINRGLLLKFLSSVRN